MASQNVQAQTTEGNNPEQAYHTRWGMLTASETARLLYERTLSRLDFLDQVLYGVCNDGNGFTLKGFSGQGLAAILEDIKDDVHEVYTYHMDDNDTPGKDYDMPVVRA